MSADSWSTCPRCRIRGDLGYKGNEFREDWEIGLNDPEQWMDESMASQPPGVIFRYRGECQRCGLLVEFDECKPVTWDSEPKGNQPTGAPSSRAWNQIPASWFVQHPTQPDKWMEVVATAEIKGRGVQEVTLKMPTGETGTWPRAATQKVTCRPGTESMPFDGPFIDATGATIIGDEL